MVLSLSAAVFRALRIYATDEIINVNRNKVNGKGSENKLNDAWKLMYITLPLNLLGDLFLTLTMEGSAPWRSLLQLHNENKFLENLLYNSGGTFTFGGLSYPTAAIYDSLAKIDALPPVNAEAALYALLLAKGFAEAMWYITEFFIVQNSGQYSCAIIGNFNRVAVIGATLAMFQNPLGQMQIVGCMLTSGGVGIKFGLCDDDEDTCKNEDERARVRQEYQQLSDEFEMKMKKLGRNLGETLDTAKKTSIVLLENIEEGLEKRDLQKLRKRLQYKEKEGKSRSSSRQGRERASSSSSGSASMRTSSDGNRVRSRSCEPVFDLLESSTACSTPILSAAGWEVD